MTAPHGGGIPSWKQSRPSMVRCVGPVEIGAHSLVKHGTDRYRACGCPVNNVAGGDARL
jgi:hypothetical protein